MDEGELDRRFGRVTRRENSKAVRTVMAVNVKGRRSDCS